MSERVSTERLLELSKDPMAATMVEVILLIDEVAANRLEVHEHNLDASFNDTKE